MRILLAAIDHNFHLFRKPKKNKEGDLVGHRKYSKRTTISCRGCERGQGLCLFPLHGCKDAGHVQRVSRQFSAKNDIDEFDPKQIAPTLALKAPPSTEELMKAPSRFSFQPKVSENIQE